MDSLAIGSAIASAPVRPRALLFVSTALVLIGIGNLVVTYLYNKLTLDQNLSGGPPGSDAMTCYAQVIKAFFSCCLTFT